MTPTDYSKLSKAELLRKKQAFERLLAAKKAQTSLIAFSKFMEPDPNAPDDVNASLYSDKAHHHVLAEALEKAENGMLLAQGIRFLCVSIGPQKGKSQLVSRNFPAWAEGRDPKRNIMLGSYNDDFAREFGDDVRNIMNKPQYSQVFPRLEGRLRTGSKAKDHMATNAGGKLNFVGRGGSGTGKPADCLPGDTLILTERGRMRLDDFIAAGMPCRIASFDHDTYNPVWRPVVAWSERNADEILQIETESGRTLRATGNHRIFVAGRGYIRAAELSVGDALLRDVRQGCGAAQARVGQEGAARHPQHVLQQGLPRGFIKQEVPVRRADRMEGSAVLLEGVLGKIRAAGRAFAHAASAAVSAVQEVVQTEVQQSAVLLEGLRQRGPLGAHAWLWQLAFQGRALVCAPVQRNEQGHRGTGRPSMPRLPRPGDEQNYFVARQESQSLRHAGASHKRGRDGQPASESDLPLRDVSRHSSQVECDTISVVRGVCAGGIKVYDIQVEGTGNFFANEVLVHNCFIVDDPLKNAEEAESLTIRNKVWEWFLKVVDSRTHGGSIIIVVQTRWHEDDLIGRLTDKTNPHYPRKMAEKTMYINIPSIVESPELAKALGLEVGASIWEEKFPLWLLEMKRDADPRGFGALEMGRPTPPEGAFYKVQQIRQCYYRDIAQLPRNLRRYGSGDLAVSDDITADDSVVLDWGVDENDVLWLLPVIHWSKKKADATVDNIVEMGKDRWMTFFGEKGQIDRSIRPFLEKRMREENAYFNIETFANINKGQAALPFRGRLAQGKVRFPAFAEWWQRAEEQMLKFTGSGDDREDDFCDALSRMGQGLQMQVTGSRTKLPSNVVEIKPGSIQWAHRQYTHQRQTEKRKKALMGM